MQSHRLSEDGDDGLDLLRLPVRRIEAIPEVARRLRGDAPADARADESGGHDRRESAAVRMPTLTPPGMFPWDRRARQADASPTTGAIPDPDDDADQDDGADHDDGTGANDDVDPNDGTRNGGEAWSDTLTDWQRQWLSLDDEEPDVDESASSSVSPAWWEGVPAVRQLLLDGLDLGPATVLVGENGSGKSTIVEALATAYGISSAGGSTGSAHRTPLDESLLAEQLHLIRGGSTGRGGYFLRAETMHGFFTYLAENPRPDTMPPDHDFLDMSHGESFVTLVEDRFRTYRPGLYLLDEPESALSFDNQLRLMRHLQMLVSTGHHQVVLATHSPILAALPGATLYELDARGFREVDHDDATLVRNWRHFMNDPSAYLG